MLTPVEMVNNEFAGYLTIKKRLVAAFLLLNLLALIFKHRRDRLFVTYSSNSFSKHIR
jgi:hypothetical protein